MALTRKPIPKSQVELSQETIEPYLNQGKAPVPANKRRENQKSVKNDDVKQFSVGLKDVDESIFYYFNNVIRPSVIQNSLKVNVPILYGSPERWKAIQADGYYRDGNGKVQSPLIVFRKSSITPVRDIGNKLDGNKVSNIILAEKRFNRRNVYDNFNILTNRVQSKEYIVAFPPDYVKVTYNCIIYTDFVEQMDKLIEAINFSSNSYWGDPSKYQFKNMIESYSNQIVMEQGADRTVKTTFDMVMNGYIIPDSLNREVASANRAFSTSQVVFGLEVADSQEQFNANIRKPKAKQISSVTAADSTNVLIQNIEQNTVIPEQTIIYLNTNVQLIGTFVNNTTITFAAGWLTAPSGLPATSISNFTIFSNGVAIPNNAIQSFSDGGTVTTLVIDTVVLEYSFTSQDVITAVGKFSI